MWPSRTFLARVRPLLRPLVRSVVRILIVDDEAPARAKMRRYVAESSDIEIVGEAETGVEAVERIAELQPDLVFLDVQMPELDGFGVIEAVGVESMPHVVFVTAFDEYALKAFEVRALDYLLKPFTPERFAAVIDRARAEIARTSSDDSTALRSKLEALLSAVATARPRYLNRILVHHANKALLLPVERIDRVEADRNYVRLHSGGTAFTLRGSLTSLAERLDPEKFLRINRSEIVRLDAVKELQPWFHGDYRVVMGDGTTLMWSRRFRAQSAGEFGET
jgi:two-component system LytT family response regulator